MFLRGFLVLAVLLILCAAALGGVRDISADAYQDKLRGMWIGEVFGQLAGSEVEGNTGYGGLGYSVPWNSFIHNSSWVGDDDTVFEYLNLTTLEAHPNPTGADVGQAWRDHIPSTSFYIANRQARWLMEYGMNPPQTGSINYNMHSYAIDSQITTESVGSAAPGMRQRAADLAGVFGSVSNDGYALHAAQYYAAMYSAAAVESDVPTLVAEGQAVVPTTSRTWRVIQDVRDWYTADVAAGSPDWRHTQEKLYDKYFLGVGDGNRYRYWIESTINTGMTTMALLYGGGDFQNTVEIAVNGGFDCDCNPATAGGLIGLLKGYSGLPANLVGTASNVYSIGTMTGLSSPVLITDIASRWQAVAETQIINNGGSITGTGTGRVYHLPAVDAIRPLLEKPDPTGPRGLAGAAKAAGQTVTVSASVAYHDPTSDRQNLDAIINGITDVSYNGHLPYTTDDGANAQPAGGDYYQINFDRKKIFASIIYYEGDIIWNYINGDPREDTPRGGYFTSLAVEVGNSGTFTPVARMHMSEPLDPYKFYQQIEMSFDPVTGDAIRIRGDAGGTDQFTSCLQLEAYGLATPGDANRDGKVDMADYVTWFTNFGSTSGTWSKCDFNNDGKVDMADYVLWFDNFGTVDASQNVPEPATWTILAACAIAAGLRRRFSRTSPARRPGR